MNIPYMYSHDESWNKNLVSLREVIRYGLYHLDKEASDSNTRLRFISGRWDTEVWKQFNHYGEEFDWHAKVNGKHYEAYSLNDLDKWLMKEAGIE